MKQKYSEPLGIDVPLGKDKSWQFPAKAAGIVIAAGAIFFGGYIFHSPTPELPANQQCIEANQAVKQAAKDFSTQLVAALDGQDAPAPDLGKVKATSKECVDTQDQVTVKVEAQK